MGGIRCLGVFLTLVGAVQDRSLDALVEQLSDDRIETREAAVQALVRLGSSCLPDLRARLEGLPPEPKARLSAVIGRLEDSARVQAYLPVYRPVSLSVEGWPAREAMKLLSERSGLPIDGATCPDGLEVTVHLEGVPPLQALNEICRAATLGWMNRNKPDWRERPVMAPYKGIFLHRVVPAYHRPMATQYLRHYRIHADLTTVTYTTSGSAEMLHLSVESAPGVRPHSASSFRLTEATDESGRNLLPHLPAAQDGFGTLPVGQTGAKLTYAFPVSIRQPVKLSRLKGSITFRYPFEVRWVRFTGPGVDACPPVEAMGLRFGLGSYRRAGKEHAVVLIATLLNGQVGRVRDILTDLPFDSGEVEVVAASGERLWSNGCFARGGGKTWELHLTMTGSKDEAATEIRIPWADRFVEDKVEFELQDVVHQ